VHKPHEEHRGKSPGGLSVRLVTVSTSRYQAREGGKELPDESADNAQGELEKLGYAVTRRDLVSDDERMIRDEVESFLKSKDDVAVLMGGTGVSSRDLTIETVRPYFEKELEGFGEILRSLSFHEIGAAAMMTRATAGVARGKLLVCLPGSPGASTLAVSALGGEFPHAVYIART